MLASSRRAALWLLLALASGACRVPREVHEPLDYPDVKLATSALELRVSDPRPPPTSSRERELVLPDDFTPTARAHLARLTLGEGPPLVVQVSVARLDAIDLVDARGEITRIAVDLDFEIGVREGPTLRRAKTHSESDLPREEATPEEIRVLLRSTALDAFDRYWANAATERALNQDLAAYQARHPGTPSPSAAGLESGKK